MSFYPAPMGMSVKMYLSDHVIASCGLGMKCTQVPESALTDPILRVEIMKSSKRIKMILLGLKTLDYDLQDYYDSVDDLPKWVQEKIALLMLVSSAPPTEEVEGVGKRISENIFWVYPPADITE